MSLATNHYLSETHNVDKTTIFTWKIYDYSASPLHIKNSMQSELFVFENSRFCVSAKFFSQYNYTSKISEYYLSVDLVVTSSLPEVDFIFSISLQDKDLRHVHNKYCYVERGQKPLSLHGIVPKTEISDNNGLLVNNCLTLVCTLKSVRPTHKMKYTTQGITSCCSRIDTLSRDLGCLFSSKENADVVFYVEDQEIPVHSQILSLRSSVFAAMFRSNFKERRTKVVKIRDAGISTINYLLRYIYTGEVQDLKELSPDLKVELYSAAEKYDLTELKDMCSQVMVSELSKDNLVKYATLADTHDDQFITKAVVAFFGWNKNMLDSDVMRELATKIPTLPMQILNSISKGT